jgi:hypothetical protein
MTGSQPTHLDAGPLRLALTPGPEGPQLELDEEFDSFCWVVGGAAEAEVEDEVCRAIERGESFGMDNFMYQRIGPEQDLGAAKEIWKRRTGEELNGDLWVACVGACNLNIFPLAAAQQAYQTLRALREKHRIEPPWLFLPKPKWEIAHRSEQDRVLKLEEALAAGAVAADRALSDLGLRSSEFAEAKFRTLVDWKALGLAQLYAPILQTKPELGLSEAPWLFAPQSAWELPHPSERRTLMELEAEAQEIDRVETDLGGADEPEELLSRRTRFLERLNACGLLSDWMYPRKKEWLDRWGFKSLLGRYNAALEALVYLDSAERRRYNPDAPEKEILKAPVCLDIFRGQRLPEGMNPHTWISWGEFLLRSHGPGSDVRAEQGDFPYHDQDGLVTVLWRKDAGIPALRYLSLQKPNT